MNIEHTPFSYFGSYFALVEENGIWLKSLRGISKKHMKTMEFIPVDTEGKQLSYSVKADYSSVYLDLENGGNVEFSFIDEKKIAISGKNCSLKIDTHPQLNFEFNFLFENVKQPYCIVNSYKNYTKQLVYPTVGTVSLEQNIAIDETGSMNETQNQSILTITENNESNFSLVVEDIDQNGAIPTIHDLDMVQVKSGLTEKFNNFTSPLLNEQNANQATLKDAAYVLWSSTVRPEGYLKRYTTYASNKNFPGSWSWDHAFIALGMAHIDEDLAVDQLFTLFDHQNDLGQLPGSVSDSTKRWNFSKPPVHGWFVLKMMELVSFSETQLEELYNNITKQVDFYFTYKDANQDGICEYHHGNDSGQDNSTVFEDLTIVDSPDLSAFLLKSMEALSVLAEKAGRKEESSQWKQKAKELAQKMLRYFFIHNQPVAKKMNTGESISSKSLLPLVSVIAGQYYPEEITKEIVTTLLSEDYLTDWGIATEAISSESYQEDAYWRGAIWGPTTLLVVEALEDLGYVEDAKKVAQRYCKLNKKSGFSENFNALTGKPLRDRSFSWTAATYIHLAKKIK